MGEVPEQQNQICPQLITVNRNCLATPYTASGRFTHTQSRTSVGGHPYPKLWYGHGQRHLSREHSTAA